MIDFGIFEEFTNKKVPIDFNFHDWMIIDWEFQLAKSRSEMRCRLVGSFDNESLFEIQLTFNDIDEFKIFPEIDEISNFWIEEYSGRYKCCIQGFKSRNEIHIICSSLKAVAIKEIEEWPSR